MTCLPIDAVIPELKAALTERHEAVLEAPPGAGKTTRVPLALLAEPWLLGQRIIMLEPRRLAARAAAERLAESLGERPGQTVGYRMRLDSKVGPNTQIEVVTEGILLRRLQEDPALEGVGLVIFDEFHERSLDGDLSLALTLSGRELFREGPALKVLLMSATLDGARLSQLLNDAPVVSSQGRMFPVATHWGQAVAGYGLDSLVERCEQTLQQALVQESGSLLVFLPGQGEILRLAERLEGKLGANVLLCPLYGELDLAAQRQAIEPAPQGFRKVVLATNIAETSLTIEGVRVVIDSGLARVPRFDPASGMTRLSTQRISQASATQRAGRAGRIEPGVCYRLWSKEQHQQLEPFTQAEILNADLTPLALQLARWGMKADELTWLDQPPVSALAQAQTLLISLGALAGENLTAHGQAMAKLPVHPRLAHMLLKGHEFGVGELAAELAALLSERDTVRGQGADLATRLQLLQSRRLKRIEQLAKQYLNLLPKMVNPVQISEHQAVGALLAWAYPDRIAKQRKAGSLEYRLANGRAAQFAVFDALSKCPWLVVADLGSHQGAREERIYLAAELDPSLFNNLLNDLVDSRQMLEWDERENLLRAEKQWRVGELVLRSQAIEADAQMRSQALIGLVRRKGLNLLPWTPELRQWQARVALMHRLDKNWPDVSDQALLGALEKWLAPYLDQVRRLAHFAELDLKAILQALLPWPLPQQLDQLAPKSLKVPSGSAINIDYCAPVPVLAVRLQELFGLAKTPTIADGKVALLLHLLSPGHRPVQVTQDLASFWQNTYSEVKKDLKGRYPKHYWPDDPLQAQATARAKPRGQ